MSTKQLTSACLMILLLSLCMSNISIATVSVPNIFSDNMVLQRNVAIPVWGWANAEEQIAIIFNNHTYSTKADNDGKWYLELPSMQAGGPYQMKIQSQNTIVLDNIMVGEVWVCSGQSNMELKVYQSMNADWEIQNANWPGIRMFTVTKAVADLPQDTCQGSWQVCNSQNVPTFSAVGYFFGRELYQQLKVPIGLIHTSWGGTPIESWMSRAALKSDMDFLPILDRYAQALLDYPERYADYLKWLKKMETSNTEIPAYHTDPGNEGFKLGWAQVNFKDDDWSVTSLPGTWEHLLNLAIDGSVWFRKTISIPKSWDRKKLALELGSIDDFDVTYFNGIAIGETGADTPSYWTHPRKYSIPDSLVKPGVGTIAVRVFDHYGEGGFSGFRDQMKIYPVGEKNNAVLIADNWRYKIEKSLDPSKVTGGGGGPQMPLGPGHSYTPSGLYNAMIYPLAPYALNGFIWYQGESNDYRAYQYRKLLPAMIFDWRKLWHKGDLYFGIVQLANYKAVSEEPTESSWAELREAQTLTAANVTNTGMAVIIDIGAADDIHPKNKQDVGKRLALWALNQSYGQKVEYSGPEFKSMVIVDNKIRIRFSHAEKGLMIKGSKDLQGFSIAGVDGRFYWATGQIDGNEVIVWSDEIKNPVAVRYAWADNPVCNLYNKEGLPAIPFRTDNFPGVTLNNR